MSRKQGKKVVRNYGKRPRKSPVHKLSVHIEADHEKPLTYGMTFRWPPTSQHKGGTVTVKGCSTIAAARKEVEQAALAQGWTRPKWWEFLRKLDETLPEASSPTVD